MSDRSTIKQIFFNAITGWGAIFIQVLIGLFMVPFLIKKMGTDGYGLIGLLTVVISFSELADLGLRTALARELSEKVTRNDKVGFRKLSSTALVLYIGIASIVVLLGWFFSPILVSFFNVGDQYHHSAIFLLRFYGGATFLLSFITPIFTSGLASFTRYDLVNFSKTGSQILVAILLFIILSFSNFSPLYIWAGVMLIGAILNLFFLKLFYNRICFSGQLQIRHLDTTELRPLFSLGWKIYVLQLTNALSQRVDPLVISRYFSTAGVALYQPAQKLVNSISPLVLILSTQLTPFTTRYHVDNQEDKQKKILFLSTRYTLLLGILFYGAVIIFAKPFSRLWLMNSLGDGYIVVSQIMQLSSIVLLLNATGGIHFSILMAQKKINFAIGLNIPFALSNIALSIFLVGYTSLGIIGVFVGTIISSTIRRPIYIWYIAKVTKAGTLTYWIKGYLPTLLFSLVIVLPGIFILNQIHLSSWWHLFIGGAIYGICAGIILLIIERKLVLKIFHKVVKK